MEKANRINVVLSTGKEVVFEFQGNLVSSGYEDTLSFDEETELLQIQRRFS